MELQSSVCDAALLLLPSLYYENPFWKPLHCFPRLKSMFGFVSTWKREVEIWGETFGGELAGVGVSVATETALLPHLLREARWTSGGAPAPSCKFILEKCRLTFQICPCHFSGIPSWVLLSSRKLPMCCFRTTDFYLASVCEGCFLSFMLKSCLCLPALFNKWIFYYAAFKNYVHLK